MPDHMLMSLSPPICHSPTPLPRSANARCVPVVGSQSKKTHLLSGSCDLRICSRAPEVESRWKTTSSDPPLMIARLLDWMEYATWRPVCDEKEAPLLGAISPMSAGGLHPGLRAPLEASFAALPGLSVPSSSPVPSVRRERSSFAKGGSGTRIKDPSVTEINRNSLVACTLFGLTPASISHIGILVGLVVSSGSKNVICSCATMATCPVSGSSAASLTPALEGWYCSSLSAPSSRSYLTRRTKPLPETTARISFSSHSIAWIAPISVLGCTSPTGTSFDVFLPLGSTW
mmetsp:Transcript_8887/g.19242  ORF Transcript_8887/g.19242 Transcript_8887/m.19242 type:complete len:288 (+) Transcript_8887:1211-2074(+)